MENSKENPHSWEKYNSDNAVYQSYEAFFEKNRQKPEDKQVNRLFFLIGGRGSGKDDVMTSAFLEEPFKNKNTLIENNDSMTPEILVWAIKEALKNNIKCTVCFCGCPLGDALKRTDLQYRGHHFTLQSHMHHREQNKLAKDIDVFKDHLNAQCMYMDAYANFGQVKPDEGDLVKFCAFTSSANENQRDLKIEKRGELETLKKMHESQTMYRRYLAFGNKESDVYVWQRMGDVEQYGLPQKRDWLPKFGDPPRLSYLEILTQSQVDTEENRGRNFSTSTQETDEAAVPTHGMENTRAARPQQTAAAARQRRTAPPGYENEPSYLWPTAASQARRRDIIPSHVGQEGETFASRFDMKTPNVSSRGRGRSAGQNTR